MIASARSAVVCHGNSDERAEALRLRAEIMQLARWFLTQVGAHDLAYQAIKEAIADAHSLATGPLRLSA